MKTTPRPAPMPEPHSAAEAEAPKWQSADLYELSVSPHNYGARLHLRLAHGDLDLGKLALSFDWRSVAAFLDFVDRKLDAVDALQLGFLARPRETVSWSFPKPDDEYQSVWMEPRFVRFDVEDSRFAVYLVDTLRPEHRIWLFLSELGLRAIVSELRAGLAQRRQARSY